MKPLGRALIFLLGLLLKLVILLITGRWVSFSPRQDGEETPSRAPGRERSAAPGRPGAVRPQRVETAAERGSAARELQSLRARQAADAPSRAGLADAEAFAAALLEPLYGYARAEGLPLVERRFVALFRAPSRLVARVRQDTRWMPLLVPADPSTPDAYARVTQQVAGQLVDDFPHLREELTAQAGLPDAARVPRDAAVYASAPELLVSAWLDAICMDALAVCLLGPAYARWLLVQETASAGARGKLVRVRHGGRLHGMPPAHVRVEVVAQSLEHLGFFEEADELREHWQRLEPGDMLLLPLADGGRVPVHDSLVLTEIDGVVRPLLSEPLHSLGGATLGDVPGFCYVHDEHAAARRASAELRQGRPLRGAARNVVAGALLAWLSDPRAEGAISRALARSIRGMDTLEAVPDTYARPPQQVAAPVVRSLRESLRNPRELRAAVRLGAAFEAPRALAPGPGRSRR